MPTPRSTRKRNRSRPTPPGTKGRSRTSDAPPPEAAHAVPQDDDGGDERGPLRRCIVTRERGDRERMIRFVIGPGEVVVPDLAARLPGRGIWLSARGDVLETARRKGAFARAARGRVTVPPDLAAIVETGLVRRVAELVGFARRAGEAVAGFGKAREWLEAGRCALLVQARDGSEDECRRLRSGFAAAGVAGGDVRSVRIATPLDKASLGAVFGRDHIVHVAIRPGRLAGSIAVEAERLSGIRLEPSRDARIVGQAGA